MSQTESARLTIIGLDADERLRIDLVVDLEETSMKTKAAVLWGLNQKWEVEEVDVDGPKRGEVLVKLDSSGLCRSDDHLVTGDMPMPPTPITTTTSPGLVSPA